MVWSHSILGRYLDSRPDSSESKKVEFSISNSFNPYPRSVFGSLALANEGIGSGRNFYSQNRSGPLRTSPLHASSIKISYLSQRDLTMFEPISLPLIY